MPRILVLHGFVQNESVSRKMFSAVANMVQGYMRDKGEVEFIYGRGPTPVPPEVALQMFKWFGMSPTDDMVREARGWWRASDDGKTYAGWEQALEYVSSLEKEHGTIDGLMGFSQGAIFSAALAARQGHLLAQGTRAGDAPLTQLKFCVFVAGWKPTSDIIAPWLAERKIALPTLHVLGEREPEHFLARMQQLVEACDSPQVVRHEAGHVVPKDESSVNDMVRFVVRNLGGVSRL